MEEKTIIELKSVSKTFPMGKSSFTALNNIHLKVYHKDFMGFVGPSGSGKTTLLNLIGVLDSPTQGSIQMLGRDIIGLNAFEAAALRRTEIGFIFQTYNLLPVYTVFENVEFPLLITGMGVEERRKAVHFALEQVGLLDKKNSRPSQLSGGESQRTAVARAIVKKPKIVIADEPTANLDTKNSHNILNTMAELNQTLGLTFLFSTHDERVVQYLTRKVTLNDGEIVKDEKLEPKKGRPVL